MIFLEILFRPGPRFSNMFSFWLVAMVVVYFYACFFALLLNSRSREFHGVRLANGMHFKSNLSEFLVIQKKSSVEQKGGLGHGIVNLLVVICLELVPFGHDTNRVSSVASLVGVRGSDDCLVQSRSVGVIDAARVIHFNPHILPRYLRIVDMNLGVFLKEITNDKHGGSFSDVSSVLLEGVSQNRNLLSRDGVEHGRDDFLRESLLLKVVHGDDLTPVLGTSMQSVRFTQVDEIENVFLEARSSKSDRRLQEALSDAVVHADGSADFGNVGTGCFAERRNGVDGRNTLRQESICNQFGQLGRPQVGGQDLFTRHPVCVDAD
mmetsp:Transcript_17313/g.31981  ORF Transcript_17313/g.31981 Transcript_17313/m.31981 type:complete len:321 (-) Transcript_17313:629-1591(-)